MFIKHHLQVFSTIILLLKHEFVCVRVRSVATNAAAYVKLTIVILVCLSIPSLAWIYLSILYFSSRFLIISIRVCKRMTSHTF